MKNFYGLISLLILLVALYYFANYNYRTSLITIINFLSLIFLISKNSNIKSFIYITLLGIVISLAAIFSYQIISNLNLSNMFFQNVFQEDFRLAADIYSLKSQNFLELDTNFTASFFAVLTLIFKEYKKKILTLLSFLFLLYTYSRGAILVAILLLIYPSKILKLKYLYIFIGILLFLFITYKGDNSEINTKLSTFTLFANSINTMSPAEFLFGIKDFSIDVQTLILEQYGKVTYGHTIFGAFVSSGIVYFIAPLTIFFLIWTRHKSLRLPILFIITYSFFSLLNLNVPLTPIVLATYFDKNNPNLNN